VGVGAVCRQDDTDPSALAPSALIVKSSADPVCPFSHAAQTEVPLLFRKNTPRVTGFLGTGDKPVALTEDEVSSILFRSDVSKEKPRLKVKFQKNESVRITEGPFANFNGVVDDVNEDRETLKVMVTIFGRSTPVELDFGKVEKIA
jgi:transcription antitermination factor NusG